jgi:NADPH-dependent 2,4-dienoyl-CoA reductase/sulfur reductase-like enzyme/Fe-S-cluster-containing hydrogenase component 2
MGRVLVFHRDHCLGCRSCELACSVAHSASGELEAAIAEKCPPVRRVVVARTPLPYGRGSDPSRDGVPSGPGAIAPDGVEALRCEQCLEPLCAFACKSGALRRDPLTGRVILDDARCVACLMCLTVCPFGIRPDPARDRVVRCDVCGDLATPACVASCPTGALTTVTPPDERVRSQFRGHVVVVGSSAAGIAACEAAREHAPGCSITLVTADTSPYSRPLLAYALAGRLEPQQTDWRTEGYLEHELGVHLMTGRKAVRVASDLGALMLDRGEELGFERLILATGARAATLAIHGANLPGVFVLRNFEDLEAISEYVAQAGVGMSADAPAEAVGRTPWSGCPLGQDALVPQPEQPHQHLAGCEQADGGVGRGPGGPPHHCIHAVVLGGGNVGLQAAEAFLARGMRVTVVAASPHLLSQMVDAEAGRRLADLFRAHGVDVRTGCDAVEVLGDGRVEAVWLNNGELLPADLLLVAKGIVPNVEWLRGSGIRIGRAISVDLSGRTNVPGIFAAGDCAEAPDPLTGRLSLSGIWPVAYEMGRAAGGTAVGIERASAGALRMNASRFFGESIISIGEVRPERLEGSSAEVLIDRAGAYRKLVYHNGRLAGALLYGDITGAGAYYRQYRECAS